MWLTRTCINVVPNFFVFSTDFSNIETHIYAKFSNILVKINLFIWHLFCAYQCFWSAWPIFPEIAFAKIWKAWRMWNDTNDWDCFFKRHEKASFCVSISFQFPNAVFRIYLHIIICVISKETFLKKREKIALLCRRKNYALKRTLSKNF